jgi:hypothetical protein
VTGRKLNPEYLKAKGERRKEEGGMRKEEEFNYRSHAQGSRFKSQGGVP